MNDINLTALLGFVVVPFFFMTLAFFAGAKQFTNWLKEKAQNKKVLKMMGIAFKILAIPEILSILLLVLVLVVLLFKPEFFWPMMLTVIYAFLGMVLAAALIAHKYLRPKKEHPEEEK